QHPLLSIPLPAAPLEPVRPEPWSRETARPNVELRSPPRALSQPEPSWARFQIRCRTPLRSRHPSGRTDSCRRCHRTSLERALYRRASHPLADPAGTGLRPSTRTLTSLRRPASPKSDSLAVHAARQAALSKSEAPTPRADRASAHDTRFSSDRDTVHQILG